MWWVLSLALAATQSPADPPAGSLMIPFDDQPCWTLLPAAGQPFEAQGVRLLDAGYHATAPTTSPPATQGATVWCGGPVSVGAHPDGGALTVPAAISGGGALNAVLVEIVDPATGAPGLTDFLRVAILSGPGSDPLDPGVAIAAYDANGDLIATDGPLGPNGWPYGWFEVSTPTPQIATVLLIATTTLEVFDNLTLNPPVPTDGDGDGWPDPVDVCPDDADPGQEDWDHDGIGDACDSPRLTVTGGCPGPLSVTIDRLTPWGSFAIVRAATLGTAVVPASHVCAGVTSGLQAGTARVLFRATADGDGVYTLTPTAGPGFCTRAVQVIDEEACAFSAPFRF